MFRILGKLHGEYVYEHLFSRGNFLVIGKDGFHLDMIDEDDNLPEGYRWMTTKEWDSFTKVGAK
jgi:hypothetical protein